MYLRTFAIALPVILGGLWVAGSFTPNAAREPVEYAEGEEDGSDDRAACRRLQARLLGAAIGSGALGGTIEDPRSAITLAATLHTYEAQWKIRDCGRFEKSGRRDPKVSYGSDYRDPDRDLRIKPGKPMLDARPPSERW